ncbi:MAG: flagellar hook basal-body protein [Acidobacteria bacterium]|nr:MAG: flagellar hook basal-body protein [Acidobacteriota bacterium]
MFPQLYTAASGLIAGERALELVTNNLANVRTRGYRPDRPVFSSYLPPGSAPRAAGPAGPVPRGVALAGSYRPDLPGPIRPTGAPLDLAIQGKGWFRVATPRGLRLTRDGSFQRDAEGRLVTAAGDPVLDDRGRPIRLPAGRVEIATDGTVRAGDNVIARIGLADAEGRELEREGGSLWRPAGTPPVLAAGETHLLQGHLEESGVNATEELVRMIEAQRMFEMQQRMVHLTANELARRALEIGNPR